MNKLLLNTISFFILKNKRKVKFKEKYTDLPLSKILSNKFKRHKKEDNIIQYLKQLDNNISAIAFNQNIKCVKPDLRQNIDWNNSYIFDFGAGMNDQFHQFCYVLKFYRERNKPKIYFNTNNTHHGDFQLLHYNIKKYIDFEEIQLPREMLKCYSDSMAYSHIYGIDDLFTNNQSKNTFNIADFRPPVLIQKFYDRTITDEHRDIMQLQTPLNQANKQKLEQIKQAENSVCLHIRMGDVLSPTINGYLVKRDYIKKSVLNMIKQLKTKNITFFVFSNSIELLKARLSEEKFDDNVVFDYVDINKDEEAYFELELMKNCQHFILSGGGFGRFASDLCSNKNKIVIQHKEYFFASNKIVKDNLMEKELEWNYRWDYDSNDWENIKIL
ncbi:MAG: hypothetical protein Ta2D_02260 [Rickettsiales bacterium]|nr:MAG: hypothetical protein Ta2D_02260 [Rickettsiales bacterium]